MTKFFFTFVLCVYVRAALKVQSGDFGTLHWEIANGTLTISRTDAMEDFNSSGSVPWYSFRSAITGVVIGDNVTSIGKNAFAGCNVLTNVTIGNKVAKIGEGAFANCVELTSVSLPDIVTTIGNNTFYGCSRLATVTIGNAVTTIGNYAFHNCTSLGEVFNKATTPQNH